MIIVATWNSEYNLSNFCHDMFSANSPYQDAIVADWFIYRLLYYIIVCVVSYGFMCLVPNKKLKVITICGSRTIQVYFWHIPIRSILYSLGFEGFFAYGIDKAILLTLFCISLVIVLSLPIFAFPTKQLMG